MRREWIEMPMCLILPCYAIRLPPCGGSGLKSVVSASSDMQIKVSLHAEGVD